jgi:predicted MFS family arabinose efflux permease
MPPGTYTVAVTCGSDTASAKFTVTNGAGASTGGGSTASQAANAVLWSGAALVLAAGLGLWLLRRRDVPVP